MPIIWCTGTVKNLANQSFAMVGTLFTLSLKKVVISVFNNITIKIRQYLINK